MSSREAILAAVKKNQPELVLSPNGIFCSDSDSDPERFSTALTAVGANVYKLKEREDVGAFVCELFPSAYRILSSASAVEGHRIENIQSASPGSLQDVQVAVIPAQFGVAENGAVWVSENDLKIRVLPFICQHLIAIVSSKDIVGNMHDAYKRIGETAYNYAVFIAGPSKTADIEQSLVLGAHGPKSMTVLIQFN